MRPGNPLLINSTNWIGDSVMSVAALRELRRLLPNHHLTLMARPWVAGLFEGQGLVDEILLRESSGFPHRSELKRFSGALLFPNSFRTALEAFLARIPQRIGYRTDGRGLLLTHRARARTGGLHRHQVYYYLDLLHQTGLSSQDYLSDTDFRPDIQLAPTAAALAGADQLLAGAAGSTRGPLIVINPGASYGPAKRWFSDRYAALADRLIESHEAQIVLIGSPAEVPLSQEIQTFMQHPARLLTGQTDLASLMGLLSRCRLLVTNDSGTMHLASALQTPQIALFGSTDDIATGPFSNRATVIHKHVECSPCLLRECPIDLRCFSRIGVEEVYEAAKAAL